MASIGRTHHLKCKKIGCKKRRPYWSDLCKEHREEERKGKTMRPANILIAGERLTNYHERGHHVFQSQQETDQAGHDPCGGERGRVQG
jgi:hypothetical protein